MHATNVLYHAHDHRAILFGRLKFCLLCRLMSDEQTDIVSNSYAIYCSVRSSLRKNSKNLRINLVNNIALVPGPQNVIWSTFTTEIFPQIIERRETFIRQMEMIKTVGQGFPRRQENAFRETSLISIKNYSG